MGRNGAMRGSRLLVAVAVALATSLTVSGAAWADTVIVRNNNDSGPGSLRQAIIAANTRSGADAISFAPRIGETIGLKKALPILRGELDVQGPGAGKLTVRRDRAPGTPLFSVFEVAESSTVTISGLRISNGRAVPERAGVGAAGGGVNNEGGTLTIRDSALLYNSAGTSGIGGGIANDGGELTVEGSTLSKNTASYSGGGISSYGGGNLKVQDSTFSLNRTSFSGGGGIDNVSGGTVTVRGSTFSGNSAGSGGGIANDGGELTVEGSTFFQNTATKSGGGAISSGCCLTLTVRDSYFAANKATGGRGGAVIVAGGDATLSRSTLFGNVARFGGGVHNVGDLVVENSTVFDNEAEYSGGGVYNDVSHDSVGTVKLESSTISANNAGDKGGGVVNAKAYATTFSLRASIVAGNDAPSGPDALSSTGTGGGFTSGGYNLVGDTSGSMGFGPTDLQNVDAGLDPEGLKDNGGSTYTIALLEGSRAVDAVQAGCPPPATDQRGVNRPQDGDGDGTVLCDIGAYELKASQ